MRKQMGFMCLVFVLAGLGFFAGAAEYSAEAISMKLAEQGHAVPAEMIEISLDNTLIEIYDEATCAAIDAAFYGYDSQRGAVGCLAQLDEGGLVVGFDPGISGAHFE